MADAKTIFLSGLYYILFWGFKEIVNDTAKGTSAAPNQPTFIKNLFLWSPVYNLWLSHFLQEKVAKLKFKIGSSFINFHILIWIKACELTCKQKIYFFSHQIFYI